MEHTDSTINELWTETASLAKPTANREYKARMFAELFGQKEAALNLYNAINGTAYTSTEDLEITTLSDVIYMTMKNDLSFMIGFTMNLYEHQSTFNPNMPLRGLSYFARLYESYVRKNDLDIFSSTLLKLPKPQYIVFYNGLSDEPERRELRLSDCFEDDGRENHLEVKAVMLNINLGYNRQLMEKCRLLYEYAVFVDTVRKYIKDGAEIKNAIEQAINICISNDILKEFLERNREGVVNMMLTEYNQELHEKNLIERGIEQGADRMSHLTRLLLKEKRYDDLEKAATDKAFRDALLTKYKL